MDPRISALLDKEAIEEVVLRYCRGIDRRDFDLVRACYHSDAQDHHGSFSGGVEEYIAWVDKLTARYRWSMHLVANILIDLDFDPNLSPEPRIRGGNGDRAACETYGISLHRSDDTRPYMNLATGFRYLDRFERREGRWKIAERTAVGEWSMKIPEEVWWEIPQDQLSGKRDASDVLYGLLASLGSKRE
ncbi:MAG: nuclear transport factor 2 family protein [bacterium]|nr:lumazine-binding family protein [Deltaproteobacteria bacterium]MCP4904648.1 nuclear transport factor 2 family protein [bacterium]